MTVTLPAGDFAARLIDWQARHGRHALPWQQTPTPYRVWLSEIMLQQTQVATVIAYFDRFVERFPQVGDLAAAAPDEVLHLWSGLGYYSRARNLHSTARIVASEFGGEFPGDIEALCALPGIGRSTAGAIVALAGNRRAAILDGNVKRVLARVHAVPGWPGGSAVMKRLWQLAEQSLPDGNYRTYTQALMDLGATVCTPRKPDCARCPLRDGCKAHRDASMDAFPGARPRRSLPQRQTCFLIIENEHAEVLLERRPPQGIWGGLWCFPETVDEDSVAHRTCELGLGGATVVERLPPLRHTFTHFRLDILPLRIAVHGADDCVREADRLCWYAATGEQRLGLSTPVRRLLKTLARSRRKP